MKEEDDMSHHNNRATSKTENIGTSGRQLHKDWRVWLGVVLMLGAMAMYVLSLDDSVIPQLFGK